MNETHNKFFVSIHGDKILILRLPLGTTQRGLLAGMPAKKCAVLSHDDALLLAAWLVATLDPDGGKFLRLLASIK